MKFICILLLVASFAEAQDFVSFLSPHAPDTILDLQGQYNPDGRIKNTKNRTQVFNSSILLGQKIYEKGKTKLTAGMRWQKLDQNNQTELSRDYYNIQGSINYRRLTDEGRFWSASLSYGAASDKPFQNGQDNTISANYIQKFNSKWFGIANYSNNRPFLNNIPLPGFFYVKEMSREKTLIFGFPIIFWQEPLSRDWAIRYTGIVPWTHRARLLFTRLPYLRPYIGLEQAPENFFRHDRDVANNRVFWFERRLVTGIEGGLSRSVRFDLGGGLAFDRETFEARNFSDKRSNSFAIENGYFVSLNLRLTF